MKAKCNMKSGFNIVAVVLLAFFMSGCLGSTASKGPEENSSIDQSKSRKTTAVYYDFEDVLIPMELSILQDRTFVVSTPGFTSGVIALKGRVERRSLFNFFSNNMQKDNWNIISRIKSPGTTIMVFQKTSRTSVITIRDEQFYTYVEVGVAPTVTGEAGLTGEPGFSESGLVE